MKCFTRILIQFFICTILCQRTWALAPVESLVLGNFSEDYSENKTDPLNYVFSNDANVKSTPAEFKTKISLYRGFYEEGKNTVNYCSQVRSITYANDWEKQQVKRSTMALVQYIGLDLITRALPLYAKKLEYTRDEYDNLINGLVGNYCSANLSVISKRELLNNFLLKYHKENTFQLPSVEGNPFFPDNLDSYLPPKKAIEQEFLYTVKLFQALCSWSGNPSNPGLMAPILKNSSLMAFFARQMSNQSIGWKELGNSLYLKDDKNTVQVWCENLVCRKVSNEVLVRKFQYSIGGTSINEDLKRLYCEDFTRADYNTDDNDPKIVKIMKSTSFDDEIFMNSQFIALITGVPDFFLRAEKFTNGEDLMRANIDYNWTKWAKNATSKLNTDLLYEEPLALELVPFNLYTNRQSSKLKVAFDVNMGEFDRINQRNGKVRMAFKIKVSNKFLDYYRRAQKEAQLAEGSERFRLMNRLTHQLEADVDKARAKLIIPPWKGNIAGIISTQLTSQIIETPERYLNFRGPGFQEIEVEINYGLFALKYINHQLNAKKSADKNTQGTLK